MNIMGTKNSQDRAQSSDGTTTDAGIYFKEDKLSTFTNLSQRLQVSLIGQRPLEREAECWPFSLSN